MLIDGSVLNARLQRHSGSNCESRTCAVTVTYGDHLNLVRPVLLALLRNTEIWKILLVTNGVRWNVQGLVQELGSDQIEAVELDKNRGSAGGYAAGIKRACDLGAEFIWLLDHDNVPQDRALSELFAAYARLNQEFSTDSLGVVAYRPLHNTDLACGVSARRVKWRPSSFWGFHILDVPYKVWRRTPWGKPRLRGGLPAEVEMSVTMFGGLLFHRAVVEKYGLPREDFVVYADDSEFTHRIVQGGGALRMITAARVDDLDASWYVQQGPNNTFARWLKGGSDTRIFYCARNHVYLDRHCLPNRRLMYWVNRRIYCLALWFLALIWGRKRRYSILHKAIRDGLVGRLGIHPEYPIAREAGN